MGKKLLKSDTSSRTSRTKTQGARTSVASIYHFTRLTLIRFTSSMSLVKLSVATFFKKTKKVGIVILQLIKSMFTRQKSALFKILK